MAKTVKTMKPAKTMSEVMGVKKAHPMGCKCPSCKKNC